MLFVGDTRILEVSMGVDCSCISVMCKAVAGAPWSEVQEDARIVAHTADAILVPVLGRSHTHACTHGRTDGRRNYFNLKLSYTRLLLS